MRTPRALAAALPLLVLGSGLSACYVPTGEGPPESSPFCAVDSIPSNEEPGATVVLVGQIDAHIRGCLDTIEDVDYLRVVGDPGGTIFVRCEASEPGAVVTQWGIDEQQDGGNFDCGADGQGGGFTSEGELLIEIRAGQGWGEPTAYRLSFSKTGIDG